MWNMSMLLIVLVSCILLGFHLGNESEKEECSRVDLDETWNKLIRVVIFHFLSFHKCWTKFRCEEWNSHCNVETVIASLSHRVTVSLSFLKLFCNKKKNQWTCYCLLIDYISLRPIYFAWLLVRQLTCLVSVALARCFTLHDLLRMISSSFFLNFFF